VDFMILNVDLASEVPIYQQLRDRIVEAIAEGVLTEGSSLPATRALAADFGINFHTVNKAYDLLRQQGLIRLNRKTGAVVTPTVADSPFRAEWTARARTVLAEAVAKGLPADEVLKTCRSVLDSFATTQPEDTPCLLPSP
jgi:DNA-binding transcriptional regulator YhcF (GntR family)